MNAAACHFPDDVLENYAMGKLSDQESEPLEEHLLLCSVCQERLEELDGFVQTIKTALVNPVRTSPARVSIRIPIQRPPRRRVSHCCS